MGALGAKQQAALYPSRSFAPSTQLRAVAPTNDSQMFVAFAQLTGSQAALVPLPVEPSCPAVPSVLGGAQIADGPRTVAQTSPALWGTIA